MRKSDILENIGFGFFYAMLVSMVIAIILIATDNDTAANIFSVLFFVFMGIGFIFILIGANSRRGGGDAGGLL